MTIQQILKKYSDVEIELLLAHTLRKPKEFLYLNPEYKLGTWQYSTLKKLINRRRKDEPIAYILGYKYFYGLKFKVNKHVLTPRPETEWLVDRAFTQVKDKRLKIKDVLDIGTGSGCIAVSLSCTLKTTNPKLNVRFTASDISASALSVAKANAKSYHTPIKFIQSDLFAKIVGTFDIVIANLPYVPQGMYELLHHHLKFEPKVAITDGSEVWEIYSRFFKGLPKHLKAHGAALLEIDDGSKSALSKIIKKALPAWKAQFYKDLGGHWRYLELTRSENI